MNRADDEQSGGDDEVLVRATGLGKRFGTFDAVDGIDLTVNRGEAFGLLGPNGAGKSSTMRMIGCVSPRTSGELTIFGLDPETEGSEIRARLGVVPQEDTLDIGLTVRDNLAVYGRFFDLPRSVIRERVDELLEFTQLSERADEKVEPLSGGMKRRLTIARALINQPDLILLDEPTTGLDPQARHLLWDRLYRLKRNGATLLLTTHYMDEAEQLCDRLVVMDGGRIVDAGSPRELIDRHCPKEVLELRFAEPREMEGAAASLRRMNYEVEEVSDRVLVYTEDGEAVMSMAGVAGVNPVSSLIRRSTLEDVFLRLTGRSLIDS